MCLYIKITPKQKKEEEVLRKKLADIQQEVIKLVAQRNDAELAFGRHKMSYTTPLVAKKDITVYKRLQKFRDDKNKLAYKTPHQGFRTKLGDILSATFKNGSSTVINDGIHAHKTLEGARNGKMAGQVIIASIIPKGTKYFLGKYRDVVAEKLIIGRTKNICV